MVQIMSLWLPIVVSAVLVFFASFVIHMVLGYHRADYKRLADENGVMDALRKFNIAPGDYLTPCAGSAKDPRGGRRPADRATAVGRGSCPAARVRSPRPA